MVQRHLQNPAVGSKLANIGTNSQLREKRQRSTGMLTGRDPQGNSVWFALRSKHNLGTQPYGKPSYGGHKHDLDWCLSSSFSPFPFFIPGSGTLYQNKNSCQAIKGAFLVGAKIGIWSPPFPPFLVPHLHLFFQETPRTIEQLHKSQARSFFAQSEHPGSPRSPQSSLPMFSL